MTCTGCESECSSVVRGSSGAMDWERLTRAGKSWTAGGEVRFSSRTLVRRSGITDALDAASDATHAARFDVPCPRCKHVGKCTTCKASGYVTATEAEAVL